MHTNFGRKDWMKEIVEPRYNIFHCIHPLTLNLRAALQPGNSAPIFRRYLLLSEGRGSKTLWNVGSSLPDYAESHPRRLIVLWDPWLMPSLFLAAMQQRLYVAIRSSIPCGSMAHRCLNKSICVYTKIYVIREGLKLSDVSITIS
jgi:hypothetical protein